MMRLKSLLLLFLFSLLCFSSRAMAFPGMIRYGYVNCTACHVSPTGDGILTPYGREISGDVLSTWSHEGEGRFLYGAFAHHLPKNLLLGGDTRVIQTYQNNPVFKEERFFLMQSDLEAAYRIGKFTLDAEAGYLDSDTFDSLRHYIMYNIDDRNILRLGKFKDAYGIITDEHQLSIKSHLGWDEETETYNLEYARLTNHYSLIATALFGAPESQSDRHGFEIGQVGMHDHGASLRASAYIADHYELGASYFYGQRYQESWRNVAGPYVILGFRPDLYYMGELDFQDLDHWGVFDYQRLTYLPIQGLQLFVTQELALPEFGSETGRLLRYGLGAQFFPRPHYELDLRWNWQQDAWDEHRFNSLAWILLHVYL